MSPRKSMEETAKQNAAKLLDYASKELFLQEADYFYAQNALLDALNLSEPYSGETGDYEFYILMNELSDYAVKKRIIEQKDKLRFETRLIGIVTPPPSKVIEFFDETARYEGTEAACDMLYELEEKCGYLRRPDIDKNIVWEYDNPRGRIIVTVNLAKPEKTPEEVKRAKEAKTGYPECVLCAENIGFAGNDATPARQTLRYIPFELNGEDWFMQFSPYAYFDRHLIAVSKEHRPMNVSKSAFERMLDFVELFPHFFIGSNAALPIVGGSILAHDHYQGGSRVLPIFERRAKKYFPAAEFPDVNISIVDWYNSALRLESKNRSRLCAAVEKFRSVWEDYCDDEVNVTAYTQADGNRIQHNAVTPLCAFNSDNEYQFTLILRNNRTDKEHPFGIFHPTEELHNIKQESIGLIEAAGLFVLPGRLFGECRAIGDILTGKTPLDFQSLSLEENPLHKHLGMIAQLAADNGTSMREEKAAQAERDYINAACEKILDTTAVFKNDEQGRNAFEKFIKSVLA